MTKDDVIRLLEAGLDKLIWPKDDRDDILLTKQAAARRLIEASIRTLFDREDPVVPLILAPAAAGILRNLMNQKDVTAVQRLYEEILELGLGRMIAAAGSEVQVEVCNLDIREIIKTFNKKANFLKHADLDSDAAIQVSTQDATTKINEAILYYIWLALPMTKQWKLSTSG